MSGGSYDYAFSRLNGFIEALELSEQTKQSPNIQLRKSFINHLKKVSEIMRIIEWVDSADSTEEEEKAVLMKFFRGVI